MKRYIRNMDYNETKKLIEHNNNLQNTLFVRAWESATDWLDDYLSGFTGRYSIGYDYDDMLEISSSDYGGCCFDGFKDWFNGVQHDYCLVSEDEEKTIREFIRYSELAYKLEYKVYAKEKDLDNVIDKMDELKEQSEKILLDRLVAEYRACYQTDTLVNEIDCLIDAHETAYINDDDYSTIFEHVKAHEEKIA